MSEASPFLCNLNRALHHLVDSSVDLVIATESRPPNCYVITPKGNGGTLSCFKIVACQPSMSLWSL